MPAHRPITVRDLLTFTMGLGIVAAEPGTVPMADALDQLELGQGTPSPAVPPAPDEWIRRLGSLPLLYQPGERWLYNTGADVLGVMIERAVGQPFETFLAQRVFEPLGMKDTGFDVPWDKIGRLPTEYVIDPGPAGRRSTTTRTTGSGAGCPRSRPAAAVWSRPRTTTLRSPTCCGRRASAAGCASCPARRWSS